MNITNLEYEDQVRAVATELAVQFWSGTKRATPDILQTADDFACYIANGMSTEEYKELQGEEFNVYRRNKAADENDG